MTEVSTLLLLIMGEILIVTTIVSVGMIVYKLIKKDRDQTAIHVLIERVRRDAPRRLDETRKLMTVHHGFEGKNLEEISAKISREERVFYQEMINTYLRRDADAIQNLNIDFEAAVDTYRNLTPHPRESPGASASDAGAETQEVERLTVENQRLADELGITMNTMGRMLSEYTSMFGGGAESVLDKAKMIEMLGDDKDPDASLPLDKAGASDAAADAATDLPETSEDNAPGVPEDTRDTGLETQQKGSLDDGLDMIALTDDDLSDIADMDQTIVIDAGEEKPDAVDVDALDQSQSSPQGKDQ